VIVDLGTGDGRPVLATAAADPRVLVIGLDADASAMAEASRRAGRPIRRGGLPNALFAVAAAEVPPAELRARADLVTVLFPWGSLLRGVVGSDGRAAAGLASLVRPDGGAIEALVSVTPRDGVDGVGSLDDAALDRLSAAHRSVGLELVSAGRASVEEVRASGSSWGRRLLAGRADRPVWRLSLRRGRPAP
jgi:16S rRNA (adenine(1408)-N(1))-methyltransferase